MYQALFKIKVIVFTTCLVTTLAQAQQAQTKPEKVAPTIQVEVFPNPSPTRIFSVVIKAIQSQPLIVQVQDALQRTVYQKTVKSAYGFSLHTLRLDTRPKGWYYLVIISAEGRVIKRLQST
ncbi:T9SS type A sorting domain-containing protein [uncultured Microscilla sp.]|uniref:T9SS type A sorting domain-containing protein n=1 Tax=uncultured Microscilla sp. TaxID=432653 RepID=UPI00261C9CFC|nr:T9SS type A sorting domain-containing protein [uncultured Microscilla sp.]